MTAHIMNLNHPTSFPALTNSCFSNNLGGACLSGHKFLNSSSVAHGEMVLLIKCYRERCVDLPVCWRLPLASGSETEGGRRLLLQGKPAGPIILDIRGWIIIFLECGTKLDKGEKWKKVGKESAKKGKEWNQEDLNDMGRRWRPHTSIKPKISSNHPCTVSEKANSMTSLLWFQDHL